MNQNFFCEFDKSPAAAFCFQGQAKLVVCAKHIEQCLAKKLDIYPLDGMRFITCPADVAAFRACSNTAMKGLAYAQVLRSQLSEELHSALTSLSASKLTCFQAITDTFHHLESKLQARHDRLGTELSELEEEFRQITRVKGVSLSPAAAAMTQSDACVPSLLGATIVSTALPAVKETIAGVQIEEFSLVHRLESTATAERRMATILDIIDLAESVISGSPSLVSLSAAHKSLQDAAQLLPTIHTPVPADTPQQLSTLQTVLTKHLRTTAVTESNQLSRTLIGFRSAESEAILAKEFTEAAEACKNEGDFEAAIQYGEHALAMVSELLPGSMELVNVSLLLALIKKRVGEMEEAELHLADALELCLKISPTSIETAKTYRRLGDLYEDMKRSEEAEQSYKDALALGLEHYPTSSETAATYNNLGIFLEGVRRYDEAETAWLHAWDIWRANNDPRAVTLAYEYLKDMYGRTGRSKDLEKLSSR